MSTEKEDSNTQINTNGGSYVDGNVQTDGGDFVSRDKFIYGDEVRGNKVTYNYYVAASKRELNLEKRYLSDLITELEARKGLLEYVSLANQTDVASEAFPNPLQYDDIWAAGFSELLPQGVQQGTEATQSEQRIRLNSIHDAIEKHDRFVLLGVPGAGKTTTIRRLALETARVRRDTPADAPLPLLLYLPQWPEDQTVEEFICAHWPFEVTPTSLLKTGDVLLYLDGLNEMGARGTAKARQLHEWLHGHDSPKHVIVTCRQADYIGNLELNIPQVLVEEMDEPRIRQFVENYLDADRVKAFLTKILPEDKHKRQHIRHLSGLARNPYMLAALIFVYDQGGELPSNTGALFQGLVRALWKRESQRDTTQGIAFKQAESAFGRLAFAIIDEDQPIDVPYEWALERLAKKRWWRRHHKRAETLLRVGVSASYVTVINGQVRFFHQLMQETFAARELGRAGPSRKLKPALISDTGRLVQKWDEVVIALCGIEDPESIIHTILREDPFLAAKCILSGVEVEVARRATVDRLSELLYDQGIKVQKNAITTLGEIAALTGDTDAIRILIDSLHSKKAEAKSKYLRRSAAEALGKVHDPRIVDPLINALGDNDWLLRQKAAEALGKTGDSRAVEALIKVLDDKPVTTSAAKALQEIGKPAVEPLVSVLQTDNQDLRQKAIQVLGRIDDVRALEPLKTALQDSNESIRQSVVLALGQIGNPFSIEPLIEALGDEDWRVRKGAAEALGQIGTSQAIEPLIKILQHDKDKYVQRSAVRALGQTGDVRAIQPLVTPIEDKKLKKRRFRHGAVHALIRIGSPAVDPLIDSLNDSGTSVRQSAASALGQIRDFRAVEPLIKTLCDDPETDVRKTAALALGTIGNPSAVQPLHDALNDTEASLVSGAAQALGQIGDTHSIPPLVDLLKRLYQTDVEEWKQARQQIAQALTRSDWCLSADEALLVYLVSGKRLEECLPPDPDIVERLLDALKDRDAILRKNAVGALGRIGDLCTVQPLLNTLKDEDTAVREETVKALGLIGDPRAVEPLLRILDDKNQQAQWLTTVRSLGQIGDSRAIGKLIDLLASGRNLSYAASFALRKIGAAAVEPLIAALNHKTMSIRIFSIHTLGKIGDERAIKPLTELLSDDTSGGWFFQGKVRDFAAEALYDIGTPRALAALRKSV